MAVVIADSSSKCTEFTLTLPASSITRGARVLAHMLFATCFTALVCLLMYGGGSMEFGESIFTGSAVVAVSRREHAIMSNSSLVPRDVQEKPLMMMSPFLLETTVGI